MKDFIYALFAFFARLGGPGLVGLGILDSSILFMPLGNDLLIVALTARKPHLLPYYAAMATLGSLLGVAITDAISRKGGEAGLENRVPKRRLEFVKRRVKKSAGWALALASIMPPPFPFTPFVIASAALQYPRKRLLGIVGVSRFARFCAVGLLAVFYGKRIVRMAETPAVQYFILGIVVISIAGSAISVIRWIMRSKKAGGNERERASV